jgi:glycosyltransferase involved in cell wall biosynthesis
MIEKPDNEVVVSLSDRSCAQSSRALSNEAMTKLPKVLAVVPLYNGRHFAKKAIKSLLSQNYPYLRIVVIDDRSDNDLASLVSKEFSEFAQVTVIRNAENIGLAQTLNKALELVTDEEFLLVLQQDCELLDDKYVMSAFEHFRYNDDVAMVSGESLLPESGELSRMKRVFVHHFCEDDYDKGIVEVGFPLLKADLFRVEVLRKAGGFESSANWKLASEDNIISHKIRSLGYKILKDPSLRFVTYWDGQEKLLQNLQKEATYGRGLGWALARMKSDLKVGESKQLRSKKIGRMFQMQYVFLTIISCFLFLYDLTIPSILLSLAALLQVGHLSIRARVLKSARDRLLFIVTGFLRAWVYIPNLCYGFFCGLVSKTRE